MSGGQFLRSNESHILSAAAHRQVRALSYPEDSEMGVSIPLNTKNFNDQKKKAKSYKHIKLKLILYCFPV